MTPGEFKAWLRGYLEAGGNDVERIAAEAERVHDSIQPVPPYQPVQPLQPYQPFEPFPIRFWSNADPSPVTCTASS